MSDDLFIDSLGDNPSSLPLHAHKRIEKYAGERVVVPCRRLDVEQFSRMRLCELDAIEDPRPERYLYWGGEEFDRLYTNYNQVVWKVRWRDHDLAIVHIEWKISMPSLTTRIDHSF
ncbi:MAG: hypothetical protein AAGJ40_09160 [Planctomycetota bacterium]